MDRRNFLKTASDFGRLPPAAEYERVVSTADQLEVAFPSPADRGGAGRDTDGGVETFGRGTDCLRTKR